MAPQNQAQARCKETAQEMVSPTSIFISFVEMRFSVAGPAPGIQVDHIFERRYITTNRAIILSSGSEKESQ